MKFAPPAHARYITSGTPSAASLADERVRNAYGPPEFTWRMVPVESKEASRQLTRQKF